jgi:hypothetical protein
MSLLRAPGIVTPVGPASRRQPVVAWALSLLALTAAGCGIRPLQHDELFGTAADAGSDVASERPSDGPLDAPADLTVDLIPDSGPDGNDRDAATEAPPPACTAESCAAEEFCDELTGRCTLRSGTGMLSGVVTDRCTGAGLSANVGIAGQHHCSFVGKGSYFFTGLPLGTLRLAVALDGYQLASMTVVVGARGTVADVALSRATPDGCVGPAPSPPVCTCVGTGCQ